MAEFQFQRHGQDTGSPEAQISLLNEEVAQLQDHLKNNPKDVDAKRSLLKKVARRRTHLRYLKKNKLETYLKVQADTGLKI